MDELRLTKFPVTFVFTEAVVSSGRVEKSPHEQEIKFFAKVRLSWSIRPISLLAFEH